MDKLKITFRCFQNPIEVSLVNGKFSGPDVTFLDTLKLLRLPDGYYPDADLDLAQLAARRFAGTITDQQVKPPRPPSGTSE